MILTELMTRLERNPLLNQNVYFSLSKPRLGDVNESNDEENISTKVYVKFSASVFLSLIRQRTVAQYLCSKIVEKLNRIRSCDADETFDCVTFQSELALIRWTLLTTPPSNTRALLHKILSRWHKSVPKRLKIPFLFSSIWNIATERRPTRFHCNFDL